MVRVDEAVSDGPGWMVIHEDASGSPGPVLGQAALTNGTNTDIVVELSRALVDQETLYAMLHVDVGTVGTYEFPGVDVPAVDGGGSVIAPAFVVTVPANLPDVLFNLQNNGFTAWQVSSVLPPSQSSRVSALGADNPTITLDTLGRYAFSNPARTSGHPFEVIDASAGVLLSQSAAGSLESDPEVMWVENGDLATFTVDATLAPVADRYRCAVHIGTMVGSLTIN